MIHEPAVLLGSVRGAAADQLEEYIRAAGLRVDRVEAGPQVMEKALFTRYDGVVLDASLSMLEGHQVRDLLKANPRTQNLPILLIDLLGETGEGAADVYIRRPLSDLRWLEPVLQAGSRGDLEGAIQADLKEMPLVDVVQMLVTNKRSGVIELESRGRYGRVELVDDGFGRIQQDDSARGLKALARIVGWDQGQLRFQPRTDVEAIMEGSAVSIMMDAIRLQDEADALREGIPPGSRLVYRTADRDTLPTDNLLEEILLLVDFYGSVDDILERLEHPDAEILKAIDRLRREEWIDIRLPEPGGAGTTTAFVDLEVRPELEAAEFPTVWLLGCDVDFIRVLWADARLTPRLVARKSLRNPGRFGGNGWFLHVGRNVYVWLRWLPVSPALPAFIQRDRLHQAGALFVVSDRDADLVEELEGIAGELGRAGMPMLWLPIDQHTGGGDPGVWVEAFGEEVPGRVLTPPSDPVAGFWEALDLLLAEAGDG